MQDPDELVSIAEFSGIEVEMARGLLEAHGINAAIRDRNHYEGDVSNERYAAFDLTPSHLQVRRTDVKLARRILDDVQLGGEFNAPQLELSEAWRCPRCDSSETIRHVDDLIYVLSMFLFALPLLLMPKHRRCERCGQVFRPDPS